MSEILTKRGLSGREAGTKTQFAKGIGLEKFDEMTVKDTITSSNVHNLSLFELRQSLKARGEFLDDYEGPINFEILLNRMVALLGEDKAKEDREIIEALEKKKLGAEKEDGTVETLQEKLARKKLERKAAAIERSRQRQADKKYFEEKKKLNDEAEKEVGKNKNKKLEGEAGEVVEDGAGEGEGEGGEKKVGGGDDDDPFKLKFRSKIGGQYA
ncbi:hypothetical protein TrVE_jg257 [Triparma verrucosa]|uniref:Uncharacterized protein n=1 Tax=Triparma verrucosa TaxID=1606542 RepID=A0A9W7FN71_9STRA|nr:hypothetical protein TrVE_jg257 [Triparma verrucosa]